MTKVAAGDEPVVPGEAMESGFRFRSTRIVPEGSLSADALRRVIEKMSSVDEARRRAAGDAHTGVIG